MSRRRVYTTHIPSPQSNTPAAALCTHDVSGIPARSDDHIGGTERDHSLTFGAKPLSTSPPFVMIDNSASHRVFKIDELTRLIAGQLILGRQRSAVNLACTCRHLEEPVLSTLWETQGSLCTLLETLPRDTWNWDNSAQGGPVVCPESPVGETERSVIISVPTRGGSVAGGLEQSPPLRVLDGPNQCG